MIFVGYSKDEINVEDGYDGGDVGDDADGDLK